MSHDPFDGKPFPRGVLYALAALLLFTMAIVFIGQRTGAGTLRLPEVSAVQERDVRFVDLGAEGLSVLDARSGNAIAQIAPGGDGFVRGVLRGMNRRRKLDGLPPTADFRLAQWTDGRLSLIDLESNQMTDLRGFGVTNLEAFAHLVDAKGAKK